MKKFSTAQLKASFAALHHTLYTGNPDRDAAYILCVKELDKRLSDGEWDCLLAEVESTKRESFALALIPNAEGYEFLAMRKNGNFIFCKVARAPNGCHYVVNYRGDVIDFTTLESWQKVE